MKNKYLTMFKLYNRIAVLSLALTLAFNGIADDGATGQADGFAGLNGGTIGGRGGDTVIVTTGTQLNKAICDRAKPNSPRIIKVMGTINHENTEKRTGNCKTSSSSIKLQEVSNLSIIGVGDQAIFDEIGIGIYQSSNIIIRNITVRNVKKRDGYDKSSNGGDAIRMDRNVSNVWVDHVTLEASGGSGEGFDSLLDLTHNVKYVTLSYSILRSSGSARAMLIGSGIEDDENNYITLHHNYYKNFKERTPLLRAGTAIHAYNNYYENIRKSAINSRSCATIRVENNFFENVKNPIGSFHDLDKFGKWDVNGNLFKDVTWSPVSAKTHPAGPDVQSNTYVDIPYSYIFDRAACVRNIVMNMAGAGTGLQTSTGNNLSIGAGADGSSKKSGTSYGDVVDGDMSTYWSPIGSTGTISVKWDENTTVNTVNIREASGFEGRIENWRLVNRNNGSTIVEGTGAGVIDFPAVSLRRLSFEIESANDTPRIAEFETYQATNTFCQCTEDCRKSISSNLSIGAGADGSSKKSGTSYGYVVDDDMNTYWSPIGTTGTISVKWDENTMVNTVRIREASGFEGRIQNWRLVNRSTGEEIISGDCLSTISFPAVSLRKLSFEIENANGTPRVAEFETYMTESSPSVITGSNLSIGAGADGSSKKGGTSYGNVVDGDMNSYWSPVGRTGTISVKWDANIMVNTVDIREASGFEGRIKNWKLVNRSNESTIVKGNGAGVISFPAVYLNKISFMIESANATPRVAEFETYMAAEEP